MLEDLSQPLPAKRVNCFFGHKPKKQKHVSAFNVELATGCKAPGCLQESIKNNADRRNQYWNRSFYVKYRPIYYQ